MARARSIGTAVVLVPALLLATFLAVLVTAAASTSPAELVGVRFEPALGRLGLAPLVLGTVVTTALAVALAAPIALVAATWLAELCPLRFRGSLGACVDGLAAVPAVVYGVWGRVELVPFIRDHVEAASPGRAVGHGFGLLSASLVLAMMCLPTVTSAALRALRAVPQVLRDASASLGASRWETLRHAVLPAARVGLLGSIVLGLVRVVGEGIAVSMVIGGRTAIPASLLEPTSTLAVALVDGQEDATHPDHLGALAAVALVLCVLGGLAMAAAQRCLATKERA